jgi:hypothetical protein
VTETFLWIESGDWRDDDGDTRVWVLSRQELLNRLREKNPEIMQTLSTPTLLGGQVLVLRNPELVVPSPPSGDWRVP